MSTRVVVAKVGLDGHDRGAKVVARLLRDDGHEVIYTGLRQQPALVVAAAEQEDADVIGLSILSGAHQVLTEAVLSELRTRGLAEDVDVVVGGTVPPHDVQPLLDAGAAAVFGIGSTLDDIRTWFQERSR
ncbi:cobalamin-dependent protein [Nocardioides sp. GXZ039]|uniref:cobalamin-dependent protein n=1 Tax=Nocardioides sp. GXZ039 TaxID=3136018 RepID=UPI0030F41F58